MRIFGGEAVRVFVHIERADQYRACRPQLPHQHGVSGGWCVVAVDDGAGQRDFAFEVEQVFHRVRQACQRRQRRAGGALRVDGVGFAARALECAQRERVDPRIGCFDAGNAFFSQSRARASPRAMAATRAKLPEESEGLEESGCVMVMESGSSR